MITGQRNTSQEEALLFQMPPCGVTPESWPHTCCFLLIHAAEVMFFMKRMKKYAGRKNALRDPEKYKKRKVLSLTRKQLEEIKTIRAEGSEFKHRRLIKKNQQGRNQVL